eukprot:629419-Pleurochrysis_carterae.AAC.2
MYLSHHRSIGLRFAKSSNPLAGYSDSDWATRHSTSGYVFMYNQAAVPWASKKQLSVALFSCEAEIIAASEVSKEAVYLRSSFADLGFEAEEPTSLSLDNKSAINLAYNPEHHQCSKHIDRRHFFVRERVESHDITVTFVCSADNLAELFLKAADAPRVFCNARHDNECREMMLVSCILARGGVKHTTLCIRSSSPKSLLFSSM